MVDKSETEFNLNKTTHFIRVCSIVEYTLGAIKNIISCIMGALRSTVKHFPELKLH